MSHLLLLGWTPGYAELLIIGVVVLLLFGHRLPSVMRSLGRGLVEFKKGTQDTSEDDVAETEDASTAEKR